jgi:hypothetical protein
MKRNIKQIILAAVAVPTLLTSCLDEVTPTSYVTEDQLGKSSIADEAILYAMPSSLNCYNVLGYTSALSSDFGYGSMMHIRDVMTGDMAILDSNYEFYGNFYTNTYLGEDWSNAQLVWWTYYTMVQSTNKSVGTFKGRDGYEGELGTSQAFRAALYLDLARMYEFLPNDKISGVNSAGNDVTNLTVPIVTDETTAEEARNNPRATRQEMYDFILSDLDSAEQNLAGYAVPSKAFPSLAVVYGLKARLYMWVENYAKAQEYARKAIAQSGATPLTQSEWFDTTSGFNSMSSNSWMWAGTQSKEDAGVQSWYYNWTSWSSNETTFGYCYYGPKTMIDASMYSYISDTDFRKLTWIAPESSKLSGKETFLNDIFKESLSEYMSLKFRPGSGAYDDANTGAVTDYPLMRVEEMYFIEAEAAAHLNAAEGRQLLIDFMTQYRDSKYKLIYTDQESVIAEIVFQKRVELWGEGQTFFDIKRLNYDVVRKYDGSNFQEDAQFNTTGRPAWMNLVIVKSESTNNTAVMNYNNPDPSGCY